MDKCRYCGVELRYPVRHFGQLGLGDATDSNVHFWREGDAADKLCNADDCLQMYKDEFHRVSPEMRAEMSAVGSTILGVIFFFILLAFAGG